jgi:colanic acid/amylovoran biosynthesis glycosyltransferase
MSVAENESPVTSADEERGACADRQICVGYLVNQYPKISHAFIRREIEALERRGVRVERFSLRLCADRLVDDADRRELERTRIVLEAGLLNIAFCCGAALCSHPLRFLSATKLALRMGRHSDRGVLVNLVYLAEACVLLKWLTRSGVDRVHAHFATNPAAVAMLCQVLGGPPWSFTAHGPDDFDRARMLSLDEKVARATFCMTVSSWGRSQLYRWCRRTHWEKIHVSHPGVGSDFLDAPAAPIPAAPRLVCVARLDEEKGHLLLLEALRGLLAEGVECELVLVGEGPLRREIEGAIARFGLREHVYLDGALSKEQVRTRIQQSRALVLASFAENLPTVILEAFALGRPVIATYVGGVPEVVDPGVTGWLAPAGSVDGLQSAMRQALLTSAEKLEQMGRNGARIVRGGFSADDNARLLMRQFRAARD